MGETKQMTMQNGISEKHLRDAENFVWELSETMRSCFLSDSQKAWRERKRHEFDDGIVFAGNFSSEAMAKITEAKQAELARRQAFKENPVYTGPFEVQEFLYAIHPLRFFEDFENASEWIKEANEIFKNLRIEIPIDEENCIRFRFEINNARILVKIGNVKLSTTKTKYKFDENKQVVSYEFTTPEEIKWTRKTMKLDFGATRESWIRVACKLITVRIPKTEKPTIENEDIWA